MPGGCWVTEEMGLTEKGLMDGFGATGMGGLGLRNGEVRGLVRESMVAPAAMVALVVIAVVAEVEDGARRNRGGGAPCFCLI